MTDLQQSGVVITMAGAGSRFVKAGYSVPKYAIEAHGRTLFAWSMHSLRDFIESGSPFYFVALATPGIESFIASQCREIGIASHRITILDAITDGQATSAKLAQQQWDDLSRPVAIYNIDTYVNPDALPVRAVRGNGWIPCFPGEGDKWSFAAADAQGRVMEVREKKRISPHASVGFYWFDSFSRYLDAYEEYYAAAEHLEASERYIAPLYNHLIRQGADVFLHEIPAGDVYPLGTPEDVELFKMRSSPDLRTLASAR